MGLHSNENDPTKETADVNILDMKRPHFAGF
jgi:hypothetical protein